jgi:retron-type reverse transcriptase
MSFDPGWRWGKGAASACARQKDADSDESNAFSCRHRREAEAAIRKPATRSAFLDQLLARTADPQNLRLAWQHLANGDGQSPGIDGLRPHDLEDYEIWALARTVGKAILTDSYRPNRDRRLAIPKSSGKGVRILAIPTVIDRMVQRGVVQTVQPYLDLLFDERSLGYRPSSDINHALAMAEKLMTRDNAWVVVTEDLENAFDQIPQQRLLDVIRRYVREDRMVQLFRRMVETRGGRGVRQGGNVSPLLLNLYLHHHLDRPWRRRQPDVVLLRWADDLLVLCRDRRQAMQAHQDLQDLLRPSGMRLKGTAEQNVHDLGNGDWAEWLGFRLAKGADGLRASMTYKCWKNLEEAMRRNHSADHSSSRTALTILGWISHMGPCFDSMSFVHTYARITALAQTLAFDEIPRPGDVHKAWTAAHRRWAALRR